MRAPYSEWAPSADYSPKRRFFSKALDSADLVRFSKSELFERLINSSETEFCSASWIEVETVRYHPACAPVAFLFGGLALVAAAVINVS